jgi:hypothetical protein
VHDRVGVGGVPMGWSTCCSGRYACMLPLTTESARVGHIEDGEGRMIESVMASLPAS